MSTDVHGRPIDLVRFIDVVPGFLTMSWRIPWIFKTVREVLGFQDDMPMSLGSLIEKNAELYPSGDALLYEDHSFSHLEFNERVNQYAHYLGSQGLGGGDIAVVMVDNRPELVMIIAALAKLGCVASLINPNQRGDVLRYSIDLARGRHFIVGEELVDAFEDIREELRLTADDRLYYQPEDGDRGLPEGYADLGETIHRHAKENPPTTRQIRLGDPFAYVFTSGTTGLPKASIQTHRRWITGGTWFAKVVMNLKPRDVLYCPLPFCHTNALNSAWSSAALSGATLAIRRKFSAGEFWSDVRSFNANAFMYIGEICRYLMNQPERPDDRDNPIRIIFGNGLRPDIWRAFKRRFGISRVYELYGAAEAPLIFTNILNVDCSVGISPTPHAVIEYDVAADEPVRGDDGFMRRVAVGETGLVVSQISEESPFVGYTDREETERKILREVFKEGDTWFNTGDLVMRQGWGHIQFVDRLGDTYRWKGENVSTSEVEKVVNCLDQVAESTAYGVQISGTDGRAGMVSIIPTVEVEDFDLALLADTLVSDLPSYAVPKFVRFKSAFVTTETLKIKKTLLRDEGFDPATIEDPLFVLLPDSREYQRLTDQLHREIVSGEHRF